MIKPPRGKENTTSNNKYTRGNSGIDIVKNRLIKRALINAVTDISKTLPQQGNTVLKNHLHLRWTEVEVARCLVELQLARYMLDDEALTRGDCRETDYTSTRASAIG